MKKALEEEILRSIEEIMPQLSHIAKTLYENPEIGCEEKLASRLLCEFLTENGFSVEKDYWKIGDVPKVKVELHARTGYSILLC